MPLSDWQENCFPEIDGIYEIHVPEHDAIGEGMDYEPMYYYALFKDGKWGVGNVKIEGCNLNHYPYHANNDPANPRKWRGVIDE